MTDRHINQEHGMEQRAVVVTTKHRGVFFGYLVESNSPHMVTLDRARMCVYWSADVRGVLGLASGGPTESCRVTHALTEPLTVYGITAVMACAEDAVARWEAGPWR
mgnify:CR=1 FL=1